MSPEEQARKAIDEKLIQAGWVIQNRDQMNPSAALGVAVREFPTSTGPVDYALFVDGAPVGVIEAKRSERGQSLSSVEEQSSRYANSIFLYVSGRHEVRFAYEATDKLIHFTDFKDEKYCARTVYNFFRPDTLQKLLRQPDTIVERIESRLSVCDSIEQTVDTALQQAEAMRQSILKDAFEGRL